MSFGKVLERLIFGSSISVSIRDDAAQFVGKQLADRCPTLGCHDSRLAQEIPIEGEGDILFHWARLHI